MRVVFLLDSISQPRYHKRIKGIQCGVDLECKIYGVDRNKYSENATNREQSIAVISSQSDGKYINKFLSLVFNVKRIINLENDSKSVFYCFGFLMMLTACMSSRKVRLVYEIGDIFYGYRKFRCFAFIFRYLDRLMIRRSHTTVVTSPGFVSYIFGNRTSPDNILSQPNKVSSEFRASKARASFADGEQMRFGYIGAFRYKETMFRFARVIGEKYPKHSFHFYGDSNLTDLAKSYAAKYTNVYYHGSFKSPEDLAVIYNSVDLVVSCYDQRDLNESIAEPNKFYEAMFFKKPIIVSEDTWVAELVNKYESGFVINALHDAEIISFLDRLSRDDIHNVVHNIQKIQPKDLVDDNSKMILERLNIYTRK